MCLFRVVMRIPQASAGGALSTELLWWLSGKESSRNAGNTGDMGSILGSAKSPGGGNGNPLQYSCLENPIDTGAQCAIVHGVAESDTTEVTEHACTHLAGGWIQPALTQ